MTPKGYLDIAGFLAFVVLIFVLVHHLESVGENRIKAQDAAAAQVAHQDMLKQQLQMQAQADQAEVQRDATQKQLDDYRTANPVGHVFVCRQGGSKPGLPSSPSANGGNAGAGAGSASIPEVPEGSVDIGSPLDAIVHAAGNLGSLYRQYQQQPTGAVK